MPCAKCYSCGNQTPNNVSGNPATCRHKTSGCGYFQCGKCKAKLCSSCGSKWD